MFAIMKEIWQDIKDYEGLYKISSLGRIKSLERVKIMPTGGKQVLPERICKQKINKGYWLINLCKYGKKETLKVHRIVCEAFHTNPFNKPSVNHKNGIKTDNRAVNVEWNTDAENMQHAIKNGLIQRKNCGSFKIGNAGGTYRPDNTGVNNGRVKLTEKEVNMIRNSKKSLRQLAKQLNVSSTAIGKIRRRETWQHILKT